MIQPYEPINISQDNIDKHDNMKTDDKNIEEEPQKELDNLLVSDYRISTITSTAQIGELINLKEMYVNIDEYIIPYEKDTDGIFYMEYGSSKNVLQYKGVNIKKKKTKRLQDNINVENTNEIEYKVKRFDNQATLFVNYKGKYVNVKFFKNGKIQMTGLNNIDAGPAIVDIGLDIIKKIYNNNTKKIVENIDNLKNTNNRIILINSDFSMNITINRSNLNKIVKNKYGNLSTFEPCRYQATKLQYYWNSNGKNINGNCNCVNEGFNHCIGKGSGNGYKNCKKITICIFQSGKIIITGSQTIQQLENCYDYIINVIRMNIDEIKQKYIPFPQQR